MADSRSEFEKELLANYKSAKIHIEKYAVHSYRGIRNAYRGLGCVGRIDSVEDLLQDSWAYVYKNARWKDLDRLTPFKLWRRAISHVARAERDYASARRGYITKYGLSIVPPASTGDEKLERQPSAKFAAQVDEMHTHKDFHRYLTLSYAELVAIYEAVIIGYQTTTELAAYFGKSESWARDKRRLLKAALQSYVRGDTSRDEGKGPKRKYD